MTVQPHRQRRARAFTLVELLVVIGIIALLISILLPSLSRARKSALAIQCTSNLRQLGAAVAMYQGDFNGAFPADLYYQHQNDPTPYFQPMEVWDIKLAPYLGITLKTPDNVVNTTPPSPLLQCPLDVRVLGYQPWGPWSRSYSANRTVDRAINPSTGLQNNPTRVNDGVIWASTPGYTGNIKITQVKRTAETCFLFEYWTVNALFSDGNRQWRPAYSGTTGYLGFAAIPKDALNNLFYHDQRLAVLWCDGHASLEDPRDAYTVAALGKRSWWTRESNIK